MSERKRPTLKRRLIGALEVPIGRSLLKWWSNRYIRTKLGLDAALFYDGFWGHEIYGRCFVDGPRFRYYANHVAAWPKKALACLDNSRDYWFHAYDPRLGDVIIDVGAGIGTDTLVFSEAVGPTGRVLAIEAHPTTYRMLEVTCRRNRLENVTPIHMAVMDRVCEVFVEDHEYHEGNAVGLTRTTKCLATPVPAASLDDICGQQGIDRADFVKMNIEGAERFAIRGMDHVLEAVRAISIAAHDFKDQCDATIHTREKVTTFLEQRGFQIITRDADPRPWARNHIHGIRPH